MPNIQALRSYSRVITTKRAGNCHACGASTVPGRDFAAVTAGGKWHGFCTACAASYAAQVAGLIKRTEAAAADASPEVLASLILPNEADLVRVVQGSATDAQGFDAVQKLQLVLRAIEAGKGAEAADADPLVAKLRAVAANPGAAPRDRSFAESLVQQVERGRTLSEKQVAVAERITGGGSSNTSYTPGVYVDTAGRFVKIQANRQKTGTYAKVWTGNGWDYAPALKGQQGMTPITPEQAASFGHEFHACVFCATPLTDDGDNRSVVVGYGPICAKRYGLPWG